MVSTDAVIGISSGRTALFLLETSSGRRARRNLENLTLLVMASLREGQLAGLLGENEKATLAESMIGKKR